MRRTCGLRGRPHCDRDALPGKLSTVSQTAPNTTPPGKRGHSRLRWLFYVLAGVVLIGVGWALGRVLPLVDNHHLAVFLVSPGFGGVAAVLAAVIAGVIAAVVSTGDRTQRERAERKAQWWARAHWALDFAVDTDPHKRQVGYRVLESLAGSEWADEHEADVIDAATEDSLDAFRPPNDTESSETVRSAPQNDPESSTRRRRWFTLRRRR